jgi:phosphoglycerate dehydrogenase-like enzyme
VLISPHVGGDTSAFWPRAHGLVAEQLRRYAAGESLRNVVDGAY